MLRNHNGCDYRQLADPSRASNQLFLVQLLDEPQQLTLAADLRWHRVLGTQHRIPGVRSRPRIDSFFIDPFDQHVVGKPSANGKKRQYRNQHDQQCK